MNTHPNIVVNEANLWRTATPGSSVNWARTPYNNTPRKKYFIVSTDTHIAPPSSLMKERIEKEFLHRIPRVERRDDGSLWAIVDGARPQRIVETELEGEDAYRSKTGASTNIFADGNTIEKRMQDLDLDGVDAELVFPNGSALMAFWTTDPLFSQAQFRVYNDWAYEMTKQHWDRMNVAACVATGNIESAIAEVRRVAALGFRVITLPNKPIFNSHSPDDINYNSKLFDPFWAVVQEADLRMTFHVSTGADPRAAKGPGGAIVNFAVHALGSASEPLVNLCASGVLDRFPKLRFSVVESGVGWVPWILDSMDEGYKKHHMWVFPKLKQGLPSEYFRECGGATFSEDRAGLSLIEKYGLESNFCWANDYPHHEGTFPHSGAAIEREFIEVTEETRAKVLGLNAARLFRFDVPEHLA